MIETKKTTAPEASVGADVVQPSQKFNTNIIANEPAQINLQTTENEKKFALNTVSMSELYDTVYPPRKPIVDGLLIAEYSDHRPYFCNQILVLSHPRRKLFCHNKGIVRILRMA